MLCHFISGCRGYFGSFKWLGSDPGSYGRDRRSDCHACNPANIDCHGTIASASGWHRRRICSTCRVCSVSRSAWDHGGHAVNGRVAVCNRWYQRCSCWHSRVASNWHLGANAGGRLNAPSGRTGRDVGCDQLPLVGRLRVQTKGAGLAIITAKQDCKDRGGEAAPTY